MKQLLTPANATFNFTAKTITFATEIPSTISHILHVTNVTRGVIYFQPQAGALFTGTYASPVLTLACSTTGHADADKLEIFYDDGIVSATGFGAAGSTTQRVALANEFGPSTYEGRFSTFRMPGLAGTAGQKLCSIHNATGSTKIVRVNTVAVDLYQTAAKAVTVAPPIIRLHRVTVLPTGGTAGSKTGKDTNQSSSASITILQHASADGTSGTAITATIPSGSVLVQEYAPRLITAAGYESADRITFFESTEGIILRALEGIVVELVYTLATQNPITDMWIGTIDWDEF